MIAYLPLENSYSFHHLLQIVNDKNSENKFAPLREGANKFIFISLKSICSLQGRGKQIDFLALE